jgi:hypothetical protein
MKIRFFLSIILPILLSFFPRTSTGQINPNYLEFQVTNGIQLSGMKPEDFTKGNFTFYNNISIGKEITSNYGIHVGLTGYSFSTIADFIRQNYLFVNVGLSYKIGSRFRIEAGTGILNNLTYNTATVCLNYNLKFMILETKFIDFLITQGAIGGFRIYQTPPIEKDILPNLGLTFSIKLGPNNLKKYK